MKTTIDVPPNFGAWLYHARLYEHNLTQRELADAAGITMRRMIAIESGQTRSHYEGTMKGLATRMNMTLPGIIEKVNELRRDHDALVVRVARFDTLLSTLTRIDDYIRHLVRSITDEMRKTEPEMMRDSYRALLFSQISQRFPDLHDPLSEFFTFLSKPETLRTLLTSLPKPDVIADIEDGFKKIEYRINEGSLILKNPELLWDCNCLSTGGTTSKCRIHGNELGAKVSDCFDENVKIVYRGFEFHWRDLDALWPPSIDSFYLINNIIDNTDLLTNPNKTVASIMDIGTGTGFLGIILSNLINSVKKLCLTDWTTTSYLYSSINWFINAEKYERNRDVSFEFRVATHSYWDYLGTDHAKDRFDLVICNPPYLPIPDRFRELRTEQTTAGTDLLEHVIRRSKDLGKTVIIQFSHLARERAEKAADESGVQLKPIGKPKVVPFRVPAPLKNPDYMNWLADKDAEGKETPWALIINENPDSKNMHHKYYHYIQSYFINT